jgi:hypothetical protein
LSPSPAALYHGHSGGLFNESSGVTAPCKTVSAEIA